MSKSRLVQTGVLNDFEQHRNYDSFGFAGGRYVARFLDKKATRELMIANQLEPEKSYVTSTRRDHKRFWGGPLDQENLYRLERSSDYRMKATAGAVDTIVRGESQVIRPLDRYKLVKVPILE